eukprot:scaffold18466_cov87-Skeletonema_dohrnii-CCMP3373.AAC.1
MARGRGYQIKDPEVAVKRIQLAYERGCHLKISPTNYSQDITFWSAAGYDNGSNARQWFINNHTTSNGTAKRNVTDVNDWISTLDVCKDDGSDFTVADLGAELDAIAEYSNEITGFYRAVIPHPTGSIAGRELKEQDSKYFKICKMVHDLLQRARKTSKSTFNIKGAIIEHLVNEHHLYWAGSDNSHVSGAGNISYNESFTEGYGAILFMMDGLPVPSSIIDNAGLLHVLPVKATVMEILKIVEASREHNATRGLASLEGQLFWRLFVGSNGEAWKSLEDLDVSSTFLEEEMEDGNLCEKCKTQKIDDYRRSKHNQTFDHEGAAARAIKQMHTGYHHGNKRAKQPSHLTYKEFQEQKEACERARERDEEAALKVKCNDHHMEDDLSLLSKILSGEVPKEDTQYSKQEVCINRKMIMRLAKLALACGLKSSDLENLDDELNELKKRVGKCAFSGLEIRWEEMETADAHHITELYNLVLIYEGNEYFFDTAKKVQAVNVPNKAEYVKILARELAISVIIRRSAHQMFHRAMHWTERGEVKDVETHFTIDHERKCFIVDVDSVEDKSLFLSVLGREDDAMIIPEEDEGNMIEVNCLTSAVDESDEIIVEGMTKEVETHQIGATSSNILPDSLQHTCSQSTQKLKESEEYDHNMLDKSASTGESLQPELELPAAAISLVSEGEGQRPIRNIKTPHYYFVREDSIMLLGRDRIVESTIWTPSLVTIPENEQLSEPELLAAAISLVNKGEGKRPIRNIKTPHYYFVRGDSIMRLGRDRIIESAVWTPSLVTIPENAQLTSIRTIQQSCSQQLQSCINARQIEFIKLGTYQGRLASSPEYDSTNGCAVISPLVVATHIYPQTLQQSNYGISNVAIDTIIDKRAPPILNAVRSKLGLSKHAPITPSDVHDYLVDFHILPHDNSVGVCGGDILNQEHLNNLVAMMVNGHEVNKKSKSARELKVGAVLFFREHVVSIIKIPLGEGACCFDLIDSLPSSRVGGMASRTRCKDRQSLVTLLRWYASSKFSESQCNFIDANKWDDSMYDSDPRVFQGFVWTELNCLTSVDESAELMVADTTRHVSVSNKESEDELVAPSSSFTSATANTSSDSIIKSTVWTPSLVTIPEIEQLSQAELELPASATSLVNEGEG